MNEIIKSTKIYLITYIKAFSIIAVIFTHCIFTNSQRYHVIFPFVINMAVPFFMIITAFNYSNSYENNNINNLVQMYNIKYIIRRFNRLFIPFLIIAVIEYLFIMPKIGYDHKFMTFIINGAFGPGSYYFPVMVQLIILFPLIFMLIKKSKKNGVILIFTFNFLFEFLSAIFNIDVNLYRLLFFRYLMYIGLGVYGFLNKGKVKDSTLKYAFIIGVFYIILSTYCPQNIFYPFVYWKGTSMMCAFYVFAIFMWCYKYYKNFKFERKIHNILETIGDASWHIFLIQMVFFVIINTPIFKMNINYKYNLLFDIILKVLICTILGVIYYKIESYLHKNINFFKKVLKLVIF